MLLIMKQSLRNRQAGSSLIEVLVSILILSFGLLSMGGMMAAAVQLPKLAGYRATASNLANNYIDRMRANPNAFTAGLYDEAVSYDGTTNAVAVTSCVYPACTPTTLATMDRTTIKSSLRRELPAGGLLMLRDTTGLSTTSGNLWIIWQEPETVSALNAGGSDNCPTQVTNFYTNPRPRCLYMRFQL